MTILKTPTIVDSGESIVDGLMAQLLNELLERPLDPVALSDFVLQFEVGGSQLRRAGDPLEKISDNCSRACLFQPAIRVKWTLNVWARSFSEAIRLVGVLVVTPSGKWLAP